jgi:hypothetical protein
LSGIKTIASFDQHQGRRILLTVVSFSTQLKQKKKRKLSYLITGFDPVIGKTVSAKYAGNLYHEVQHDNGDRYVVRFLFSLSHFSQLIERFS